MGGLPTRSGGRRASRGSLLRATRELAGHPVVCTHMYMHIYMYIIIYAIHSNPYNASFKPLNSRLRPPPGVLCAETQHSLPDSTRREG